jgi:alpha-D-ribose 1-methylphosphonate 5-triphosphate diphosphatase
MIEISSGRVLTASGWSDQSLFISDGIFTAPAAAAARLDASGLLVLPGMIDIHGDAFERQIMPRPNVAFDLGLALRDTDQQLIANGITTAYHGVTSSWEPGLRRLENARALALTIADLRGRTACDMRFHLRHEAFNIEGEDETLGWIEEGLVDAFAFNDHMRGIVLGKPIKASKKRDMITRSGLSENEFMELIDRTLTREAEIPASLARLAEAARRKGIPLLSHDDRHEEDLDFFDRLGCSISEFPTEIDVAEKAAQRGKDIVFGAPNVIRGGSHTGCPAAIDMVERQFCNILASDYYYPALLHAPFRLAHNKKIELAEAWNLVSRNPARALGLADRGTIENGKRADFLLVEQCDDGPRLVATIAYGEIVWMSDWKILKA